MSHPKKWIAVPRIQVWKVCLAWCFSALAIAASARGSVAKYTTTMVSDYVASLKGNPYVYSTTSGDEHFVLGKSHGWTSSPTVPQHDLYGFLITGSSTPVNKSKIVLISGNHNTEDSGNWVLQGLLDFLLSDDWHAAMLRDLAEFYVYPMVNPDGRHIHYGRGNPELTSLGYSDHNRVWDKTGISTIDVFTTAMKEDTGGSADYYFDFHDRASLNMLLATSELIDSPFCEALQNHAPIDIVPSEGETGMSRLWAASSSGLNATYAYTPEFTHLYSSSYYKDLGQDYGLALYDTLIPEPAALTLFLLGSILFRKGRYEKNIKLV